MSKKYNMPSLGLFGKRCRIQHVSNMKDGFVYRIVNSGIRSNSWKELPLGHYGDKPVQHDTMEDVIIVVCDTLIDEMSRLERVALKDVVLMEEPQTGHWINLEKTKYKGQVLPSWGRYECSECGNHGEGSFRYCPTCGAKMKSEG